MYCTGILSRYVGFGAARLTHTQLVKIQARNPETCCFVFILFICVANNQLQMMFALNSGGY